MLTWTRVANIEARDPRRRQIGFVNRWGSSTTGRSSLPRSYVHPPRTDGVLELLNVVELQGVFSLLV